MSVGLAADWKLPQTWCDWALKARPDFTITHVRKSAKKFHEYYAAQHATRDSEEQWEQAFHAWIRRQRIESLNVTIRKDDQWWMSASGIVAKGEEFGIEYDKKECFVYFKLRVFEAVGPGPWEKR